jgi:hypothetical protein
MILNLQCAHLRLAVVAPPPWPVAKPATDKLPRAANDDYRVWPLIPFPAGWYASN